jgi:DNA-binding SARP family transcriptional activator
MIKIGFHDQGDDMTERMDEISIEMLGAFSVRYRGNEIVLGRNSTAKFIQLLQLVWLRGEQGISKQQVLRCLYEGDDLSNPNNSFNNLLFQTRKQMVCAGLPHMDYIVKMGKIYIPDPNVPIHVDVLEFREAIAAARRENVNEERKLSFYRKAFDLYQGVLLPELGNKSWVVTDAAKLQDEFSEAVRYVGEAAKRKKDYEEMYHIYEKAARIYPDNDWQASQIEALIFKENFKDALRLYDRTVNRYSDEMGLPPSEKMLENFRRMSQKVVSPVSQIRDIQSSLQEKTMDGGYYCNYPGFIDVYHAMERNMVRSGDSVFLLLCTLVDYAGKLIQNRNKLETRSDVLKQCIGKSLHQGDVYTRYSASQYLVLLPGSSMEECDAVSKNISAKLQEMEGNRAGVRYSSVSLANMPYVIPGK